MTQHHSARHGALADGGSQTSSSLTDTVYPSDGGDQIRDKGSKS